MSTESIAVSRHMETEVASPVRFVVGTTIVEPTFILRESFTCVARASLHPMRMTRTLKARGADTHLVRFRF
jgi:hypothetical protein